MGAGIKSIVKKRGTARTTASGRFLGVTTRGPGGKKGETRRMKGKCEDCLWNWENVHTGEGRVCYHNMSPRYHKEAGGGACCRFEFRVGEGHSR